MGKIVAVENHLNHLKPDLEAEGYSVVGMSKNDLNQAQAVIISGGDQNLMQMESVIVDVPVISAEGKDSQEIIQSLKKRL